MEELQATKIARAARYTVIQHPNSPLKRHNNFKIFSLSYLSQPKKIRIVTTLGGPVAILN